MFSTQDSIITCNPSKLENYKNVLTLLNIKKTEDRFLILFKMAIEKFTVINFSIKEEIQKEWKDLSERFEKLRKSFVFKEGECETIARDQISFFALELTKKTNFILGKEIVYRDLPQLDDFDSESEKAIKREYGLGIFNYFIKLKEEISSLRESQQNKITSLTCKLKDWDTDISPFLKEIFKVQNAVNNFLKLVNEIEVVDSKCLVLRAVSQMENILLVSKGIVVWHLRAIETLKSEAIPIPSKNQNEKDKCESKTQ